MVNASENMLTNIRFGGCFASSTCESESVEKSVFSDISESDMLPSWVRCENLLSIDLEGKEIERVQDGHGGAIRNLLLLFRLFLGRDSDCELHTVERSVL